MSIHNRIETIRQKPEHIRMRYVLGSVFLSMLLISILWIFSITTSFQRQKESLPPISPETQNQPKQGQGMSGTPTNQSDIAPSLNDWIKK